MEPVKKKQKKALKKVIQVNLKHAKGFVKFCYIFTWFLRVAAVLLGIATIINVALFSEYPGVDCMYLIITFGFPFGFSYCSAIVYTMSCSGEYRLRGNETITITDDSFKYAYLDKRLSLVDATVIHHGKFNECSRFEYDETTKLLTLYGKFTFEYYENGQLKDSGVCEALSLLDVYGVEFREVLVNAQVLEG